MLTANFWFLQKKIIIITFFYVSPLVAPCDNEIVLASFNCQLTVLNVAQPSYTVGPTRSLNVVTG